MSDKSLPAIVEFIENQDRFNREIVSVITSKTGEDELFENRLAEIEKTLESHSDILVTIIELLVKGAL